MSKPAALYCLLLCTAHALFVAESAIPNHWSSFYYHRAFAGRQQQQAAQCDASAVSPASLVCKSARLTTPGGNNTYIHVCPVDGNSTAVCFNSKLDRCCPGQVATCISKTTLTVANKVKVEVKLYYNVTGHICIDFSQDITRCCPLIDPGLPVNCREPGPVTTPAPVTTPPPPPPCVPKRDIYFVVDSTDSIGDDIFCRFGYVLQLITAAVNPQGANSDGARMAAVLFEFQPHTSASYLFKLEDSCNGIVSTNISGVVYEYYAIGQNPNMNRSKLQYPNVRATSTQPYSALTLVRNSARAERNRAQEGTGRPSSVVIMTDGKSHQTVTGVIDDLKEISDPLIAAGIGLDTDQEFLLTLASNSSTVVYDNNTDNALRLGRRIIEVMRNTAALCEDEAERILAALDATQETDIQGYCQSCLWTPKENRDSTKCNGLIPTCGAQNLMMQSFVDSKSNNVFSAEWEKLLLEGEIAKAVENVIAKING